MAGKHIAAFGPFPYGAQGNDLFAWNPRGTRAYAEGRGGTAANGHAPGSLAFIAWTLGSVNSSDADYQFETAIE